MKHDHLPLSISVLCVIFVGFVFPVHAQQFWGSTSQGGTYNAGTIYRTDQMGGNHQLVHTFERMPSIYWDRASWTQAPNGKFYGAIENAGAYNVGAILELDLRSGDYRLVHTFSSDNQELYYPGHTLVAYNGKLYGFARGGGVNGQGAIFSFDPSTGAVEIQAFFDFTDYVYHPSAIGFTLVGAKFFAVSSAGGEFGFGAIITFDPVTKALQRVYDFRHEDLLANNQHSLEHPFVEYAGKLYAWATNPNTGLPVLFSYEPGTGAIARVYEATENGDLGYIYNMNAVVLYGGKLYGTAASAGADGIGRLYAIDLGNGSLEVLQEFSYGELFKGQHPYGLVEQNGVLYGMLSHGVEGYGGLFEYRLNTGTFALRHAFQYDWQKPYNFYHPGGKPLLYDGGFYGIYTSGGWSGSGGMFRWDILANTVSDVMAFYHSKQGAVPNGRLAEINGKVYGTTREGGNHNSGVIFEIDQQTGQYTIKHHFDAASGQPTQNHLLAVNGKLYGHNQAYVYAYDPISNAFVKVEAHEIVQESGYQLWSHLDGRFVELDGKIYFNTAQGGNQARGAIFSIDPSVPFSAAAFDLTYEFQIGEEYYPYGDLLAYGGKLYGVTMHFDDVNDGNGSYGALFAVDPTTKTKETVHRFAYNSAIGVHPDGTLTITGDKLYGKTSSGSSGSGSGKVFEYDLSTNQIRGLIGFPDHQTLYSLRGLEGNLYGITSGTTGQGEVFAFVVEDNRYEPKKQFEYQYIDGYNPTPASLYFIKAPQTIAFPELEEKIYTDADFAPGATAASGLPIVYTSGNTTVATITETGQIHIVGVGTTEIKAFQAGNEIYKPAEAVRLLTVHKAPQAIIFEPLPLSVTPESEPITPVFSVDTDLPLVLASGNPEVAEIVDNSTIVIHGTGSAEITVSQAGNEFYLEAAETQTLHVREVSLSTTSIAENNNIDDVVADVSVQLANHGLAFAYELADGDGSDDNGSFAIVGQQLTAAETFDYEAKHSYYVRLRATSGALAYERAFNIIVSDVNEQPYDLALSNAEIDENNEVGALVGDLSAVDPDAGNELTYTLVSGSGSADNGTFRIEGTALLADAAFDFETKASYAIRIRVSDQDGLYNELPVTIQIGDVNEAPTAIVLTPGAIDENNVAGANVGQLAAVDPDADEAHTHALVSGEGSADNAAFTIVGNALNANGVLDYETKDSYSIRVRTTDKGGLTVEQALTIAVNDTNDPPTDIVLDNASVTENLPAATIVGNFSALDADAGDSHGYALVAGAGDTDNAAFTITANGLRTAQPFDFESKNGYSIRVRATDGAGASVERVFTITVTDVNEPPTGLRLDNATIAENNGLGDVVGTLSANDPDAGDVVTFALVAGQGAVDNVAFTIVGNELRAAEAFDHEVKASYSIRVRVEDADGLGTEQVFQVVVSDVNEAPTDIFLSALYFSEKKPVGHEVAVISSNDPEGTHGLTYALVAGQGAADNAKFAIDGTSLRTDAGFEYATGPLQYQVRIRVEDAEGLAIEKAFTLNLTEENDAPTDIFISNQAIAENEPAGTVVGVLTAEDPNIVKSFTYTLAPGLGADDNSRFAIEDDELVSVGPLDFEERDAYSVRIKVIDQGNLTFEKAFAITVIDVNDRPEGLALSVNTITENNAVGDAIGELSAEDQDANETLAYSLADGEGGADNASFSIDGHTLKAAVAFDYESRQSHSVRIRVTDAGGLWSEQVFAILVEDLNEAPTGISLDEATIAENNAVGDAVGVLAADDADADESAAFELVAGDGDDDNASFRISGAELRAAEAFDYETKHSYTVRVRVTDKGGLAYEQAVAVTIANVNEAPTAVSLSANSVAENNAIGDVVAMLGASDPDASEALTYALVTGDGSVDNASFTIAGAELRAAASFDFETKASYGIRIRVTDAGGLTFDQAFVISVTDINDAPTAITLDKASIAENGEAGDAIGGFGAVDQDAGDTFTYALVAGEGGVDNASFAIDGDLLRAAAAFDHETKDRYRIRVRVTDQGGAVHEQVFEIAVTDVNEQPTDITLDATAIAENNAIGAVVGTLGAIDEDADEQFTFAIMPGFADGASFGIEGNQLKALVSFDHEIKQDYSIWIRVTDNGGLGFDKVFTITIGDVNEAPTALALSNDVLAENNALGALVGSLSATDTDADEAFAYALVAGEGGDDNGSFTIAGDELRAAALFDYETKGTYRIRVRVTDRGGLTYEQGFTIRVADQNEAPTAITLDNASVAENRAAGAVVGALSATDEDAGDTFAYALAAGEGDADNASFAIVGGELQTAAPFDYETKDTYAIRVRVTDAGGLTHEQAFSITVEDENESPTGISLSTNSIAENNAIGDVVAALEASDPDASDAFTYALATGDGDVDNASFTIAGNELRAAASFDYETKGAYRIRVRVTDAGGLTLERAFEITVMDINDAPTAITLDNASVAENRAAGAVVGSLSAMDEDAGDTFTYALIAGTGDDGNASFTIVGDELRAADSFDYETKDTYSIRVRVTDRGGLTSEQAFTVRIADENEAPTALALDKATVAENLGTGAVVGGLSATDQDADETFTYALVVGDGGTDNASFAIDGRRLVTAAPFDYEAKRSYGVRIRATDAGGLWFERAFTIAIEDENEAPTALTLGNATIAENNAVGAAIGRLGASDPDTDDAFTYALVVGDGSADNTAFRIVGDELRAAVVFDYETKDRYSIRIRVSDRDGLWFERSFAIAITDVPEGPEVIRFTASALYENSATGTLVGTLASDPEALGPFTYSLVAGDGSNDNASFSVSGNRLLTARPLDFEAQSTYRVRVRSANAGGRLERELTIALLDVNERPTMDAIANAVVCHPDVNGHRIALSGITAGDEASQTVSLAVAATGADLFETLAVATGNGETGELSYVLKPGANGTALITVTVTDNGGTANGGVDSYAVDFTFEVDPIQVAIASAGGTRLSKGETRTLTATGAGTFTWEAAEGVVGSLNQATLTVRPARTTTYRVVGTNANGCSMASEITIEVIDDYAAIKATNILTPNGDGVNDTWVVENLDMYPNHEVRIFDKSGRILYTKRGYANDWNGTFNGSPLREDTYYYIIDFGDARARARGFITIVRD